MYVNKIGFMINDSNEKGMVVRRGFFLDLLLQYEDKRFWGIPAPLVEGEENYRDSCGVYVMYDCITKDIFVDEKLIYIDFDGEDFVFGKIDEGEKREIYEQVMLYGEDMFREFEKEDAKDPNSFLNDYSREDFAERFEPYFK